MATTAPWKGATLAFARDKAGGLALAFALDRRPFATRRNASERVYRRLRSAGLLSEDLKGRIAPPTYTRGAVVLRSACAAPPPFSSHIAISSTTIPERH